jgi:hypothetical protein
MLIIATAALAAATLAPAAPPPPDEAAEAAVLEAFVAELEAEAIDYLAPVCVFWVVASDNPDVTIWRCYATLGTADDIVWDVATGLATHNTATGETAAVETLAYTESGLISLYCGSTGELSLSCP